eukprot:9366787-Alexandrium_andersonii.AAC.1
MALAATDVGQAEHKAHREEHRDGLRAEALEGHYHVDDQVGQAEHKVQHEEHRDGPRAEALEDRCH